MPRQKSLMGEPILCNALSAIMSCVENPDPGLVGACGSGDGKGSYTLAVLYFSLELKREQERLYKEGKTSLEVLAEMCRQLVIEAKKRERGA